MPPESAAAGGAVVGSVLKYIQAAEERKRKERELRAKMDAEAIGRQRQSLDSLMALSSRLKL